MAVAFVNSTSGTFNAASGSPTAFSVTKGNLITVIISIRGSATVSSITDTVGTSYSRAKAQANGTTVNCEAWYGVAGATNASDTITVNLSTSSKTAVCVAQYSGAGAIGATSGSTGSTSTPSVSVTTVLGNDSWVVGGTASQGTGTLSAGSGTTQEATANTSGGSSSTNVGGDEVDNHAAVNHGTTVTLNVTLFVAATNSMVGVEVGNSPVRVFKFKRGRPSFARPRTRLLRIRRTPPPPTRTPRFRIVKPQPGPPLKGRTKMIRFRRPPLTFVPKTPGQLHVVTLLKKGVVGRPKTRLVRIRRPSQTFVPKAPSQLRIRTSLRKGVQGKPHSRTIRGSRPPLVAVPKAPGQLRVRTLQRKGVQGKPHSIITRIRRQLPPSPARVPRIVIATPRPKPPRSMRRAQTVRFGGRKTTPLARPKRVHFVRPQRRAPLRPKKHTMRFGYKPRPAQLWVKGTRPVPQLGIRRSRIRPVSYPPKPRSKTAGRLRRPPQSWAKGTRLVGQLGIKAVQSRPLKGVPREGSLTKIKGRSPVVAIAPVFRVKRRQAYPENVYKVLPKSKLTFRRAKGQESVEIGGGKVAKGSAVGQTTKGTASLTAKKVKGTQQAAKD